MHAHRCLVLPSLLCLTWLLASTPRAAEPAGRLAYDEQVLKSARVAVTGPELLEFFRQRTLGPERVQRIPMLIQHLGAHQFLRREAAARELILFGRLAAPALELGMHHPDPEVAVRSERCLTAIAERSEASLVVAAVRVLTERQPSGAIEVLLAYLPSVGEEAIEEEVLSALAQLGVRVGQPAAVLIEAARSDCLQHRLAAASALVRAKAPEHRDTVRQLLVDPEPRVRWHAARVLLTAQDKAAILPLIDLVGHGPPHLARRADQVLGILAGEGRPSVRPEPSHPGPRRQCLADWTAWWRKHEADLDLSKLAALLVEQPDFTQVVQQALKIIQESLAGSPDQKMQNRAWVQAMMIAAFAQTGPDGAGTPHRATLRDSALQLATTIRAKKLDEARQQLKVFPYLRPVRPAPVGNVRILGLHITLDEVMHQFSRQKSGGLDISWRLAKLEQEAQKTKELPSAVMNEELALTALHLAKVAELLKEHVPHKKPLEWQQHVENFQSSALKLSVAVRARSGPETIKALGQLNVACSNCHEIFRD